MGSLDMNRRHSMQKIVNARRAVVGEKVVRDVATQNQGNVHLGEGAAPTFAPRAICSGEKVVRDAATQTQGEVCLGAGAARVLGAAACRAGGRLVRWASAPNQGVVLC